ncbi:MAG: hypothetical protein M3Z04_16585 [Chloroflexota bacterium]|nr:hypothetical protein [Chloroflexota bacterium]
MKINIAYLHDILASMIDGSYLSGLTIDYYTSCVADYYDSFYGTLDKQTREQFRAGLQMTLQYILNNPQLDYNGLFAEFALHNLASQHEVEQVFLFIWSQFFGAEDWHDPQLADPNLHTALVEEAIWNSNGSLRAGVR